MAAISKVVLAQLEKQHGLSEDGLTYQQRCSRLAAIEKGETWEMPKSPDLKRGTIEPDQARNTPANAISTHPLFGKRLLITPMMTPDKNRALYFDEPVGPDIEVEEAQAGQMLWGASDDVDRMVGDYKIIKRNPNRIITAKTTLPKSGQEISWELGKEIVPVVRGNDGQRGYVWILTTHMRQYRDTMVQIYGLKTLIQQVYPELLPRFAGKPVMMYVDGLVLAASIPQTDAILKEQRRKELQDAKLGLT
jgi:hypothetical protein